MVCLHVCIQTMCVPNIHRGQKSVSFCLELQMMGSCRPYGCVEANQVPYESSQVFSTAEPSLQPRPTPTLKSFYLCF